MEREKRKGHVPPQFPEQILHTKQKSKSGFPGVRFLSDRHILLAEKYARPTIHSPAQFGTSDYPQPLAVARLLISSLHLSFGTLLASFIHTAQYLLNMSMAVGSKLHFEPGSWLEATYDVYIGCIVGVGHFVSIVGKWWYTAVAIPALNLVGFELSGDKEVQSKDGLKTLKVVGVGYGRTGTVSLSFWGSFIFPLRDTWAIYGTFFGSSRVIRLNNLTVFERRRSVRLWKLIGDTNDQLSLTPSMLWLSSLLLPLVSVLRETCLGGARVAYFAHAALV